MKKRFVFALGKISEDQEKAIVDYLNSHSLGWWHWIDNFWMVIDTHGAIGSAGKLRDHLSEIVPEPYKLVIEITGDPNFWAGFGPNSEHRNMFDWLQNTWKED